MLSKKYTVAIVLFLLLLSAATVVFLWQKQGNTATASTVEKTDKAGITIPDSTSVPEPPAALVDVNQAVVIRNYFKFMDDLVCHYTDSVPYPLNEHIIVRANPWLIDSLTETDYYRRMERGIFVYDQRQMVVLKPGDTLRLPGPATAAALAEQIKNTRLDINIPAFRLRIVQADSTIYDFPVRVGKNEKKYLGMIGHAVDLRTQTGVGEIIRINRDPAFYKPETGETYGALLLRSLKTGYYIMKNTIAIGVDIGGTHITCAAVSLQDGRLLEGTISREVCSHEAPAVQILNAWAAALNRTIRLVDDVQLTGIGL